MKISEYKCPKGVIPTFKLSKQVYNLRKRFNLTQKQLAELIKSNQATISAYETGERKISLATMEKMAKAVGVDIEHPKFVI